MPGWLAFNIQSEDGIILPKQAQIEQGEPFSLLSGQYGIKKVNLGGIYSFHETGEYRVVATIKIAQWSQQVTSSQAKFIVMNGIVMKELPDLTFGVPPAPGQPSALPEIRKYVILKTELLREDDSTKGSTMGKPRDPEDVLYFQLTDSTGAKPIRTFLLGRVINLTTKPEARLDKDSNLHLLYQQGPKSYSYFAISPNGILLLRQVP